MKYLPCGGKNITTFWKNFLQKALCLSFRPEKFFVSASGDTHNNAPQILDRHYFIVQTLVTSDLHWLTGDFLHWFGNFVLELVT